MKTVLIAINNKKFTAKMITDKLLAMGGVFNEGAALSVALTRETPAFVSVNALGEFHFTNACWGTDVIDKVDVMTAETFGEFVC
ncbi:MAG: hypothetical protein RR280_01130 [Bacteroidaceae bacterium]